jgi:hypothetical protein
MKYQNTLKLILESEVTISLYQMDCLQSHDKQSEISLGELYGKLGFNTTEYEAVTKILNEWAEKSKEKSAPAPRPKKDAIGVKLSEHISKLNSTEICLVLSNLEPDKAYNLYRNTDFRVIHEAFNLWSVQKLLDLSDNFESAVVAAGGSLSAKNKKVIRSKDMKAEVPISFN